MNICELTQALVNIESTTGNECRVGEFLIAHLSPMAAQFGGQVERQEVEAERFNVLATWGEPVVTLSTHMDTVPPYFPAGEDGDLIRGRGSCDAKGIIAAMIEGARRLLEAGTRGIALLFVVGEEKNSAGAKVARGIRAGPASLFAASRRRTNWRSDPRAACDTKSSPPEKWGIRPIRNWENRRSINCWTRFKGSGRFQCRPTICSGHRQ